jgi:DNA-directed RNA polymerase specialized sigma24 family protein
MNPPGQPLPCSVEPPSNDLFTEIWPTIQKVARGFVSTVVPREDREQIAAVAVLSAMDQIRKADNPKAYAIATAKRALVEQHRQDSTILSASARAQTRPASGWRQTALSNLRVVDLDAHPGLDVPADGLSLDALVDMLGRIDELLAKANLTTTESLIIRWKFGAIDGQSRTVVEAGKAMGLNERQAQSAYTTAVKKLKQVPR